MSDSYRPRYGRDDHGPPAIPADLRESMYHFQGNGSHFPPYAPRGPPNQRPGFRYHKDRPYGERVPSIHQRPLLRVRQDGREETFSPHNSSSKNKFRDLKDLTDSEEEDMSESTSAEDQEQRPVKRARLDATPTSKWSNPDPYTALPPLSDVTETRMDVVKLIRKAKLVDDARSLDLDMTNNTDFISFDDIVDGTESMQSGPTESGPTNLGKRKRDDIEAKPKRSASRALKQNPILSEWRTPKDGDYAPWLSPCSQHDSASIALHKEIIDFYEWVRPQPYEEEVRADVLRRLSLSFNQIEMGGQLKAFGSYAAGLYLPSSDMDLVFLQRSFRPDFPLPATRSTMNRFAKRLHEKNLAKPGSVLLIHWAKVPIIKFVDAVSGLKVDLSFNNDSGLVANETFNKWKSQYPSLPIIVSIIKQFLMLRGLNDVATGGLGGFSIICLVTSLLQHMPGERSPINLGQVLVEFFNLYGNLIDKGTVAIRLDPPSYVDKRDYRAHLFDKDKAGRLTIIDPNRPDNNISGGTREIQSIQACFSSAHQILDDLLTKFDPKADNHGFSFLKDLIGGNFEHYEAQRMKCKNLYFGLTGKEAESNPTAPLPLPQPSTASGFAAPPSTSSIQQAAGKRKAAAPKKAKPVKTKPDEDKSAPPVQKSTKLGKAARRALRLKLARPELASQIGKSISEAQAVKLGNYESVEAMRAVLIKQDSNSKTRKKMARKAKIADNVPSAQV